MNEKLVVFLRKPVLGKVKTRLSAAIGNEKALSVYQWLIQYTVEIVDQVKAECHYYFDELDEDFSIKKGQFIHKQEGQDLGEKMGQAFFQSLTSIGNKAVIIGSDCPEIKPETISEAYEGLDKCDVVVGPALDGGFYLIGLKVFSEELFNNIHWGGADVNKALLSNASRLGLSVLVLDPKRDIDELSDFRHFQTKYEEFQLKNMANVN